MVAVVGQVGRGNDIGYAEYGAFLACNWMVAVNLPTVAYWQYACSDTVVAYSVAGYH